MSASSSAADARDGVVEETIDEATMVEISDALQKLTTSENAQEQQQTPRRNNRRSGKKKKASVSKQQDERDRGDAYVSCRSDASMSKPKSRSDGGGGVQRYEAGTCRICFGETTEPQLVAPCNCLGDRRLVHPQCLIRWQQQGHLLECEVCHSPWTFGLQANAAPPNQEVAEQNFAACQAAIRADDLPSLRRRLSSHIVQSSGPELLLLAAQQDQPGALEELVRAGADCRAAVEGHALRVRDFTTARRIIRAGGVSLPFSLIDDADKIFEEGPGGVPVGCPGNNSKVVERVVRGDADFVRILWAFGIDLNDPRHRFGEEQMPPLIMAIHHAPETVARASPGMRPHVGRTNVVRALIECEADINHCTERSTALISAIIEDDIESTILLLHAGASTSVRPSIIQRADWVLGDVTHTSSSRCSPELLRAFVTFQLTGLTRHASEELSLDPRRAMATENRRQHMPEMGVAGMVQSVKKVAKKSGSQIRELGNQCVRLKDWENAVIHYSFALVAGVFKEPGGEDVDADPEPHKILCNRSLAHLRLAQVHAKEEAEASSEMEAKALMAASGKRKVALPPLPDLMYAVGEEMLAVGKEVKPEQAARGLRRSMMYRALAFADAVRAVADAPTPWGKAHARVAEAAYEIGLQCWARADHHGVSAMRQVLGNEYRIAAELEPSAGFVAAAIKAEKELLEPMPSRPGDDDDDEEDWPALAHLRQQVFVLVKAGVSEDDLAAVGFILPPPTSWMWTDKENGLKESDVATLQSQLDDIMDRHPEFTEKLKVFNRRRMQGGTDVPATREIAAAAPFGAADEWWTMSYATIGYTKGECPFWAISVLDGTPAPHRYSDMMVGAGTHHGNDAPSYEEVEDTLLRAIQYPMEKTGPSRRPRRLVLAWRMRGMLDAIRELARFLGIEVEIETYEVAVAIAKAHGSSIEGRNHGPGCGDCEDCG